MKTAAAALIALTLFALGPRAPIAPLLALAAIELAAATLTTHAAARLDHRTPLLLVEFLHQFGAAIWIGGIPCFLLALSRVQNAQSWRLVGARFSRMSMAGVACILVSGITMSLFYIGDWEGFYGTAYGVMVGAKIAMFLMLLGLGGGNFLLVERLRARPATPVTRLKRFAEVEIGIGVAIFFAAASLTSVPPAVDLTQDRVTWPEIVERNTPQWPRLRLAGPRQAGAAGVAGEAGRRGGAQQRDSRRSPSCRAPAICRRATPPTSRWSEYNHHWSGLFVLAIGLLSLLNAAGLRWARHWPLLFLGLAAFLFLRSDPEVWPLGEIGFFDSFRDVEVLQHRVFVVLIAAFAIFEWRVRTGRDVKPVGAPGVSAALRRRRHAAADPQPRHRQREGSAADRADPHAAGARRHRRRLGTLAGTAARPGDQPGRLAHRALAVAGVLHPGRPDAAELSRGVGVAQDTASATPRRP